jgi:hypothetical protein
MASSKKIDADEAIERKGEFGGNKEEALKYIEERQDERFTDIRSLRFGWVDQSPDKDKKDIKLMSMLPNGKVVFPDRSEDLDTIVPEEPYICLVYEREREAFAKVLFQEYQPKIYIPPTRIPAMVWRDESGKVRRKLPHGKTYEERLIKAIKEMESRGFETIKIVFRKNMR